MITELRFKETGSVDSLKRVGVGHKRKVFWDTPDPGAMGRNDMKSGVLEVVSPDLLVFVDPLRPDDKREFEKEQINTMLDNQGLKSTLEIDGAVLDLFRSGDRTKIKYWWSSEDTQT